MKTFIQKNKKVSIAALIAAIYALALVLRAQPYFLLVGCYICLYSVAVSGLDVLFGFCGQISFGHAAYFCVGAYVSGCLSKYFDWPVLLTMIIGAAVATAVGALIAWPSTKLVYHFLSLATISFASIVNQLVRVSPGKVTGDSLGLKVPPLRLFGINCSKFLPFFIFAFTVLLVTMLLKRNIVHSRVGRAFIAIRENPHAANGMGINVRKYKVIAFATSAFFTGLAGAMFGHLLLFIIPDQFKQNVSVLFMTMLMLGGSGSIIGPIIGVAAIQLLMELLRFAEDYQMLIYGATLLLVILLLPGGIYGSVKARIQKKLHERKAAATDEPEKK